jgi:hypothetical protein
MDMNQTESQLDLITNNQYQQYRIVLWIWGVSKVDKFPLRSIDTECPRTSSETLTHILGKTKNIESFDIN